ncbi:hypothetical protein [Blautia wexlerae]|uniref:hypothetical protein n=1 Tax=Blautia wexlerae TaxID=418240 RepID=UPI00325A9D70
MMNMEVNISVNIQATRKFYKVIVISVGLYESDIVNERHFADRDSAVAYTETLPAGLISLLMEV